MSEGRLRFIQLIGKINLTFFLQMLSNTEQLNTLKEFCPALTGKIYENARLKYDEGSV